ncbi:D-alanyl-D-alanine carboxypeptidase/D-alanyl-D-alanine endopeptidase [Actinocatenispora thailandica]|uniref:D-alanyl-D-alanine carboxypeptidase/D-alanyl-D-alanine endopeptidase n=1 Tax=Actinocatenispora thailandica TaxID=227318 RepID=UPI0031CE40DB
MPGNAPATGTAQVPAAGTDQVPAPPFDTDATRSIPRASAETAPGRASRETATGRAGGETAAGHAAAGTGDGAGHPGTANGAGPGTANGAGPGAANGAGPATGSGPGAADGAGHPGTAGQAADAEAPPVPVEPPTLRLPARPPTPPPPPAEVPAPARSRPGRPNRILIGALAALGVLVLIAGGLVVFRPGPVEKLFADGATPSPSPSTAAPSPVLAPVSGAAAPTPAGVARALGSKLTDPRLGARTAVSVVDVATNSALYGKTPNAMEVPASVTKLVTASAVLTVRGPTYRLTTSVVAGSKPGEVILVGGGDPTLATNGHSTYPEAARLDKLADQVKKALHGTKPTRVLVDSSLFGGAGTGPGWDDDIVSGGDAAPIRPVMLNAGRVDPNGATAVRSTEPDLDAGRKLAQLIGAPTSTVAHGTAPSGARRLGAVKSPPLLHLIEMMLQRSDNVIAETMARQVALAEGKPATFAGGAAATTEVIERLGLNTSGLRLHDGSGLSRKDRISPSFLTSLLTSITDGKHPKLWPVWTGMPVAGYTGTLMNRYTRAAGDAKGAGLIRAKTGSLNGTSTLAGLVLDSDGRLLAFAMMAEGVTDWGGAEAALDEAATTLVGCGCR